MKKMIFFIVTAFLMTSCGGVNSNKSYSSVEAEDLLYITNKTVVLMDGCIDSQEKKSCDRAQEYLDKYPWLLTRKVGITNMSGMRQNEWETQITVVGKNLAKISKRQKSFKIDALHKKQWESKKKSGLLVNDPFPSLRLSNTNLELTKSYITSEIKNSDFEERLVNENREVAVCFSKTKSDAIRNISAIKDQVTDEVTVGLLEVMTASDISTVKSSVYTGTISRYFLENAGHFQTKYLSSELKKRCVELRDKFQ